MLEQHDDKVSILLVDDRPEKLLAIEAVLEDLHQNIVRAYSGREALRHVLNQEFAVILLDVNMPGMDGFETAELIRQRKSSQHLPIIFITAMSDEMHAQQGYKLGAVDYILTPVVPEVLRSKVAVFVDLFKKTRQVQRQAESLRRRATQLQQLTAASVAINSALSVERMLQTVTETARIVVGTHQSITLFIVPGGSDQRSTKTQSFSSFSDKYAPWRTQKLQLDPIADTLVARSHTATRMTEQELREHPDWEIVKQLNIPPVRGGMLAAPLTGRNGNNLGVIYLADRHEGSFTSDDEAVIVQLAQMASIAVENAIYAEEREANRIKDEFLSTLSHELRTPLNAILGWTQLLKLEKLDGEVAHGLEVIDRNARAQTKLIEDLLDVSRITTGKLRLNLKPASPTSVVEAAVDAVRPAAEAKKITLERNMDAAGAEIVGDPDRLQQVVWNLLQNALKFTPRGGRIVTTLDRVEGQVRIRVQDSGQGIAPEFLPYVFDRFRQADSTSTRTHGGLGIGLTIVRRIVELHRGTVTAESAGKDQGSTFTVMLPVTAVRAPGEEGEPAGGAKAAAARPVHLAGYRVLVVDDEPDAREVITTVVQRAGAEVTAAGSVREAIDAFRTARPDLLVSDIAMPDDDGYSLIRAIRLLAADAGGATPAIALTAYAREEDRAAALSAGFQHHLSKPCDPTELLSLLAELAESLPERPEASERVKLGIG
jgi:signal transduction histidine kinase/DNA-binding response OmpR family regulator